jgi:hypothetical protein
MTPADCTLTEFFYAKPDSRSRFARRFYKSAGSFLVEDDRAPAVEVDVVFEVRLQPRRSAEWRPEKSFGLKVLQTPKGHVG